MSSIFVEDEKELPLLGIRRRVLYPGLLLRLTIGRQKSVRLVTDSFWDGKNRTFKKNSTIFVCTVVSNNNEGEEKKKGEKEKSAASNSNSSAVELITRQIPDAEEQMVYQVGTVARVIQLSRVNNTESQTTQFSMLVEGMYRARLLDFVRVEPFCIARIESLEAMEKKQAEDTEARALALNLKQAAQELIELQKKINPSANTNLGGVKAKEVLERLDRTSPARLADLLASNLDASVEERQEILSELSLANRMTRTLELLNRQIEVLKLSDKIQSQVEGKMKNTQREYFLRQQLKAIIEELNTINGKGGAGSEKDEIELLEESLNNHKLPEEVQTVVMRDLSRLKSMQPAQPEFSVIRTYLEWIADLPWNDATKDNLDIRNARDQLDADHHALDKVKKRIVEFLAVRSLMKSAAGPILCLVGPPGVGKTSLGRSVAEALGRKFTRLALGGVRDEAEIRGHRRTYIGAMPGNIIQALKKAGSHNPVMLLDEVDKLGRDNRGDPGSALLEVLDPEQNNTFTDHYLNIPFDLSKIMFIATANTAETIPGPLLDRMEVIQLPGYTMLEKAEIAKQHLIPKQMERHGIDINHVKFLPKAVDFIISGYTREAGVRNLDREIAAICRNAAVKVAESRDMSLSKKMDELSQSGSSAGVAQVMSNQEEDSVLDDVVVAEDEDVTEALPLVLDDSFQCLVVDEKVVSEILGPIKFESELAQRTATPGVATGMAYTRVGGEILFIEASIHRGSGRLQLTGQLGSVMEESVRAALSFIRSNLVELNLTEFGGKPVDIQSAITRADLHVHFPAGAVPKDGPSAGVAITAAILSALSGRCVRADTACTGEITLRGLVLPVGGIKEKVIAAHRAGVKRVVLPKRCEKDVVDIPQEVRDDIEIIYVQYILEALSHLFEDDVSDTVPAWVEETLRNDKKSKAKESGMSRGPVIPPQEQDDDSIRPSLSSQQGNKKQDDGVDLCGPILRSTL